MMFIKIMTCYAQHRSKGIHHYNKALRVHCSCYHGYRKKEQLNSSILRDSRLSRLCRGVQLYPHGRTGLTTIPLHESKGCLMPSNLSLIRPECQMKGSTRWPGQVSTIFLVPRVRLLYCIGSQVCYVHHLPSAIPLASLTDRHVIISYLAC